MADEGEAKSPDPRDESEEERADRNLGELLQELRVAGLGVQVLFGFLLSLPFTNRFTHLSPGQRNLYLGTIVLAAVATALLLGPVAGPAAPGAAGSGWAGPTGRRPRRRAQPTRRLAPCVAACRAAPASTPSPAASMKLTRSRSATSGRPADASVNRRSRSPAADAKSTSPASVTST